MAAFHAADNHSSTLVFRKALRSAWDNLAAAGHATSRVQTCRFRGVTLWQLLWSFCGCVSRFSTVESIMLFALCFFIWHVAADGHLLSTARVQLARLCETAAIVASAAGELAVLMNQTDEGCGFCNAFAADDSAVSNASVSVGVCRRGPGRHMRIIGTAMGASHPWLANRSSVLDKMLSPKPAQKLPCSRGLKQAVSVPTRSTAGITGSGERR